MAVLAGGLSLERDVSLRSGRRVAEALERRGHLVTRLDLDAQLVASLEERPPQVVYLALHGRAGEDGTIQGLLDVLRVPYTGPDAVASALTWDKGLFKGLVRRAGLPTPDWAVVSSDGIRDLGAARTFERIVAQLGLPLVVKPAQGGAAMGVRSVLRGDELAAAVLAALSYHPVALVERLVTGTEIAVAIVDGEHLPAVEVVPRDGAAYDFTARYTPGATEFFAPARLPAVVLARAAEVAMAAYRVAGCRHTSRADLIVDADGTPWLLEVDTSPGMTETSLLPMAAAAGGLDFDELCERIVDRALADAAPVGAR